MMRIFAGIALGVMVAIPTVAAALSAVEQSNSQQQSVTRSDWRGIQGIMRAVKIKFASNPAAVMGSTAVGAAPSATSDVPTTPEDLPFGEEIDPSDPDYGGDY